jgi:asparagine synthase (glutamine-hydrolysing)
MREVYTIAGVLGSRRRSFPRLLKEFVFEPLISEPLQRVEAVFDKPRLPADCFGQFIDKEFARRVSWAERWRERSRARALTARSARDEHFNDLCFSPIATVLEVCNKAAAEFRITPLFPFADRPLVEFCFGAPTDQKYRKGWTRVMARRAMHEYLPQKIRARHGKQYLQGVHGHSFTVRGQQELKSVIQSGLTVAAPYLDVPAVQRCFQQTLSLEGSATRNRAHETTLATWYAVTLARWLELRKTWRQEP